MLKFQLLISRKLYSIGDFFIRLGESIGCEAARQLYEEGQDKPF